MRLNTLHGGQCCGVHHLYGFQGVSSKQRGPGDKYEQQRTFFNRQMDTFNQKDHGIFGLSGGKQGKLIEVILTDYQIRSCRAWISLLKANGFRLVTRFHNSTGGWCNVFHLTTQQCGDLTIPKWWENEEKVGEAVSKAKGSE